MGKAAVEQQQPAGAVELAGSNTVTMFERLAKDPNVPVDKLERLVALQERVMAKNAEAEFNAALAQMQADLPTIGERGGIKDRAGNVQSTYALWEDVNRAILPVLKAHGFSLTFRQDSSEKGICVTGVLAHRGGHSERTSITLPADTSGSKNAVQSVGSSVSYGKRYTAGMLLNLTSCGEDDDGHRAGLKPITDDQAATLQALIDETKADKAKFLRYFKVRALEELPAQAYSDAVAALEAKRKQS